MTDAVGEIVPKLSTSSIEPFVTRCRFGARGVQKSHCVQVDAMSPNVVRIYASEKSVLRRIHNTVHDCRIQQTSVQHLVFIITVNFSFLVTA